MGNGGPVRDAGSATSTRASGRTPSTQPAPEISAEAWTFAYEHRSLVWFYVDRLSPHAMGENDRGEAFAAGLERGARAVAKFHPGAGCSLRTWFSNAARHGIQDELRIQGNRRGWSRHRGQVVQMLSLDRFSAESEEGGEWFGREEPGFEEVESKLLLPRLAARLTETEREVLRLYFVEELTHPEIGKRFGFSESRACQIKVRAVNKLRDQLDREAS